MTDKYDFKALANLDRDVNYILTTQKLTYVNVCGYKIINEIENPFIIYLFLINNKNSRLYLPKINIENVQYNEETLLDFLKEGIVNQFSMEHSRKEMNKERVIFKGIDIFNGEGYLFFDLNNIETIYNINNSYRFLLINEIINSETMNYKIDVNDTDFFTKNIDYGLLYDYNGTQIETPIALYYGLSKKELDYNFSIGIKKCKGIFGTAYYLKNYIGACYDNEYVIRVVVFLGNMCLKENFPNDNHDNLDVSKKRECLLLRISDYNEFWKKEYDSIYVGKIELDNGQIFKGPLYALKKYNQFIQLSYEYVRL